MKPRPNAWLSDDEFDAPRGRVHTTDVFWQRPADEDDPAAARGGAGSAAQSAGALGESMYSSRSFGVGIGGTPPRSAVAGSSALRSRISSPFLAPHGGYRAGGDALIAYPPAFSHDPISISLRRPSLPEELPAVVSLHNALLQVKYEDEFFTSLYKDPSTVSLAAFANGGMCGVATARASQVMGVMAFLRYVVGGHRVGYIMTLGVLPMYRGQGIGARLITALCGELATRMGCTSVGLHCLADNAAARALYSSCGFSQEGGLLVGHYSFQGAQHDAVYLVREGLQEVVFQSALRMGGARGDGGGEGRHEDDLGPGDAARLPPATLFSRIFGSQRQGGGPSSPSPAAAPRLGSGSSSAKHRHVKLWSPTTMASSQLPLPAARRGGGGGAALIGGDSSGAGSGASSSATSPRAAQSAATAAVWGRGAGAVPAPRGTGIGGQTGEAPQRAVANDISPSDTGDRVHGAGVASQGALGALRLLLFRLWLSWRLFLAMTQRLSGGHAPPPEIIVRLAAAASAAASSSSARGDGHSSGRRLREGDEERGGGPGVGAGGGGGVGHGEQALLLARRDGSSSSSSAPDGGTWGSGGGRYPAVGGYHGGSGAFNPASPSRGVPTSSTTAPASPTAPPSTYAPAAAVASSAAPRPGLSQLALPYSAAAVGGAPSALLAAAAGGGAPALLASHHQSPPSAGASGWIPTQGSTVGAAALGSPGAKVIVGSATGHSASGASPFASAEGLPKAIVGGAPSSSAPPYASAVQPPLALALPPASPGPSPSVAALRGGAMHSAPHPAGPDVDAGGSGGDWSGRSSISEGGGRGDPGPWGGGAAIASERSSGGGGDSSGRAYHSDREVDQGGVSQWQSQLSAALPRPAPPYPAQQQQQPWQVHGQSYDQQLHQRQQQPQQFPQQQYSPQLQHQYAPHAAQGRGPEAPPSPPLHAHQHRHHHDVSGTNSRRGSEGPLPHHQQQQPAATAAAHASGLRAVATSFPAASYETPRVVGQGGAGPASPPLPHHGAYASGGSRWAAGPGSHSVAVGASGGFGSPAYGLGTGFEPPTQQHHPGDTGPPPGHSAQQPQQWGEPLGLGSMMTSGPYSPSSAYLSPSYRGAGVAHPPLHPPHPAPAVPPGSASASSGGNVFSGGHSPVSTARPHHRDGAYAVVEVTRPREPPQSAVATDGWGAAGQAGQQHSLVHNSPPAHSYQQQQPHYHASPQGAPVHQGGPAAPPPHGSSGGGKRPSPRGREITL